MKRNSYYIIYTITLYHLRCSIVAPPSASTVTTGRAKPPFGPKIYVMHITVCEYRAMEVNCISWLLDFYILATSKLISEGLLICGSAHSWQMYSGAPLGDQATNTFGLISH